MTIEKDNEQKNSSSQHEKEEKKTAEMHEQQPTLQAQQSSESAGHKEPQGEPSKEAAASAEGRPVERGKAPGRTGARGTAAMDPKTRQEVARKGGLAVSRNKQHMAEIGRKGGQSVSKNREHMAEIGRKGGAASRGHR